MSGAARAPAGSGSGPAHTTLAISQVHKESWFRSFHPQWQTHAAAYELLFRPRQWVREAVRCEMRAGGLLPGRFSVAHLRESAEKRRVLPPSLYRASRRIDARACAACARIRKERGHTLAPLRSYPAAIEAMLREGNESTLFLQARPSPNAR